MYKLHIQTTTTNMERRSVPLDQALDLVIGGNSTFTLLSLATGKRFTYRVKAPKNDKNGRPIQRDLSTMFFVSILTGRDNESNFGYIGYIFFNRSTNTWIYRHGGTKISATADSVVAFNHSFNNIISPRRTTVVKKDGSIAIIPLEFWHEGKCCRCGRKLTVPSSIASGIGPECASIRSLAIRRP